MVSKIYHPIRKRDCKVWERRIEKLMKLRERPRILLVPSFDDEVFGTYNPVHKHVIIYTPAGLTVSTLAHEYVHHAYFIDFERRSTPDRPYPTKWHTIHFFRRLIQLHIDIEHHYRTRVAMMYPPGDGRRSMEKALEEFGMKHVKKYLSKYAT